jgi:hypothetical protein
LGKTIVSAYMRFFVDQATSPTSISLDFHTPPV